MDNGMRQLMYNLVEAWTTKSTKFDDYIPGKGRGLIGLLHGPPGLGKTLTAEAIAETAELPLYQLSSGSLGHTSAQISKTLAAILDLTSHWKAVLLLDEADVFLAKRDENNLERNAVVSVFLRELEYYPGIMILTSNKADIIDSAFESKFRTKRLVSRLTVIGRIHFAYEYTHLDVVAREKIWRNFASNANSLSHLKIDVDDDSFSRLSRWDLNGRQVT
jgi:SpoVK/Ycf46/Vps4 family AAA+-type ATPase